MEAVHEKEQQLLGVLLVIASKLIIDLSDGDLKVSWTDTPVQPGPQRLHDHAKFLRHFPFMAENVAPAQRTREEAFLLSIQR